MQVHGLIQQFPKEIKTVIVAFVVVLSIGFYGGLKFVDKTTNFQSKGIENHYLGNENDENAETMMFKKNEQEILTIVHNHMLSLSVIFLLLSLILSTTSINKKLKYFLMVEPFFSIILTFGGLYYLWKGLLWVKYLIIFSGVFMTLSFALATGFILYEILLKKSTSI